MGRTGRVVAALAIGWFLLVAPAAMAASDTPTQHSASIAVLAQAPSTPSQQPTPPGTNQPAPQQPFNQRSLVGVGGILLIALVLLARKLRGKPVFGTWRPKG